MLLFSTEWHSKGCLNCCRIVDHTQKIIFYGTYAELQKEQIMHYQKNGF